MKRIALLIGVAIVLLILMISGLSLVGGTMKVEAASDSGNTSDIQLLARAINRRSKRRAI